MNVAIIPARGGSKRIEAKNRRIFNGRPIIEWPILTAIESGCFDTILVSTDSLEIAEIAVRLGAAVPALRPASLSGDFAGSSDVIKYEIGQLQARGFELEMVCELYATSVLLEVSDLQRSYEVAKSSKKFVFSAAAYRSPVQRSFYLRDGFIEMLFPEHFKARSQDLAQVCHDAGQFYWADARKWVTDDFVFGQETEAFMLADNKVIDIDTMSDWVLAEVMHANKDKLSV